MAEGVKNELYNWDEDEWVMLNMVKLQLTGDVIFVKGHINYDTVMLVYQQGLTLMSSMKHIEVDLQGVEKSDSSSLALLIEWIRNSKARQQSITFLNIPKFVQDLAKACGVNLIISGVTHG